MGNRSDSDNATRGTSSGKVIGAVFSMRFEVVGHSCENRLNKVAYPAWRVDFVEIFQLQSMYDHGAFAECHNTSTLIRPDLVDRCQRQGVVKSCPIFEQVMLRDNAVPFE